ncbi:MAG: histidine phosphatase family protein [Actinomycetaceae bacterium]|nr:histidine phosphatase family protein [Actinomycetaceae bacterium]
MRIYLIRHGQTDMNAVHTIDSYYPGASLSRLGQRQAAGLVGHFDGVPLGGIFVSNLVRTHETAAPLAASRGLVPTELPGLREIEAGSWEGGSDAIAYDGYRSTIQRWVEGALDERMGGGVSGAQVLERYDGAIAQIEASGVDEVAVVSHGGVIGFWTAMRVSGITLRLLAGREQTNAKMCVIEGSLAEGYRGLSCYGERIVA